MSEPGDGDCVCSFQHHSKARLFRKQNLFYRIHATAHSFGCNNYNTESCERSTSRKYRNNNRKFRNNNSIVKNDHPIESHHINCISRHHLRFDQNMTRIDLLHPFVRKFRILFRRSDGGGRKNIVSGTIPDNTLGICTASVVVALQPWLQSV